MSVIHTESFIAFGLDTAPDDGSAAAVAMRQATAANLARAGYDVVIAGNSAAANMAGFAMRADPVAPDRNALTLSTAVGTNTSSGACLRRKMPLTTKPIIFGFSLYIPADFVPGTSTSAPLLRLIGDLASSTAWTATANTAPTVGLEKELFRIRPDLTFSIYAETPISSKKLGIGKLNYIECRVSDSDVRVWLDDTLVYQKAMGRCCDTIGWAFETLSSTGMGAGVGTRWALSNIYFLAEDGVAPSVRLGPTTRVVGTRPDADVAVQFTRPAGQPSNASVVAQNLVDAPPLSLQSTTVGDQDVYTPRPDAATAGATMVHAVITKALAANLESSPHSLRPFVTSGGVEVVDQRPADMQAIVAPTTRNYLACERRPTDGKLFIVGQGFSVLRSPVNGDGRQFELMTDDGTAGTNNCIAFAPNGTGLIGRSDGKITLIDPTTDALTTYSVGTTALAVAIQTCIVTPNGNYIVYATNGAIRRSATPATQASWVAQTAGSNTFADVSYNPNSNVITLTTTVAGVAAHYQSSDQGLTYAAITTANTNFPGTVFDGTYTYLINNPLNTPANPAVYRSLDGKTSFVQVVSTSNYVAGTNPGVQGVAANAETGEIITVGAGGGWVTSNDGVWWSRKPSMGTTMRGVCRADKGWLVVGDTGTIYVLRPGAENAPLPPLGGYVPTINATAFDPATGTNWQPGAAAVADFGMRLTS